MVSVLETICITISPFLLHTFVSICSFGYWLFSVIRCGPSIQRRFGTNIPDKKTWAIVTGATSGVGLGFAQELAAAGMNLLLISRTQSKLDATATELQAKNEIDVKILALDLEKFPREAYNETHFLRDVKALTNNESIDLLVCNAGMSDLARHFTDKSLERNLNLINLNTVANVTMIQTLLRDLALSSDGKMKAHKGGVITIGALTSLYPAPVYGISSGNKHFMRGFTLAARHEFSGKIDFLVAHPVAVYSNILSTKASYGISPKSLHKKRLQTFQKDAEKVMDVCCMKW